MYTITLRVLTVGLLLVVLVLLLALLQPSPFLALSPGPAIPMNSALIYRPGLNRAAASDGPFELMTVEVRPLNWGSYWYDAATQHLPTAVSVTAPGTAPGLVASEETQQLLMSEATAWAVAWGQVTHHVIAGGGATIVATTQTTPATLRIGQTIVAFDAAPVATASELVALLHQATPGRHTLRVLTNSSLHVVTVTLPASRSLGLAVQTQPATTPQPQPQMLLAGIGGPSGGLMLALTYTDVLSSGQLAPHTTVAGTGEISLSGKISPIAGVSDKVKAAVTNHASVFFVPAAEAYQAQATAPPSLKVVPVTTYRQALQWLCGHGGGHSSACRPAR